MTTTPEPTGVSDEESRSMSVDDLMERAEGWLERWSRRARIEGWPVNHPNYRASSLVRDLLAALEKESLDAAWLKEIDTGLGGEVAHLRHALKEIRDAKYWHDIEDIQDDARRALDRITEPEAP